MLNWPMVALGWVMTSSSAGRQLPPHPRARLEPATSDAGRSSARRAQRGELEFRDLS
jgi:hypothetical protein